MYTCPICGINPSGGDPDNFCDECCAHEEREPGWIDDILEDRYFADIMPDDYMCLRDHDASNAYCQGCQGLCQWHNEPCPDYMITDITDYFFV